MRHNRISISFCLIVVTLLMSVSLASIAQQDTWWVSVNGSDDGPGTPAEPFRTIQRAADVAEAGSTVMVMPGVYEERIIVRHSGTEAEPITFQSTERWGAILTLDSPWLFKPEKTDDQWSSYYVTIRGFVFQDTPEGDEGRGVQNLIQYRAAVMGAKGWRIEDCLFQRVGGGIFLRGEEGNVDDVTIERTVFQDVLENSIAAHGSTFEGMDEYIMQNLLIRDVIIRRGNRAAHHPGGTTGAQKILLSNNTRQEYVTSYDNVGTGLWLDYQNSNYSIVNSTVFGNHGLNADWEGTGIWTEINPGPGLIANNLVFSNTGSGIGVLESQNTTVRDNIIVDVHNGIEFRNLEDRAYDLHDNIIEGNLIRPRAGRPGINANVGEMTDILDTQDIGDNTYDPSTAKWVNWGSTSCVGADDCATALTIDSAGRAQSVELPPGFQRIPVFVTNNPTQFQQVNSANEQIAIDAVVAGHALGSTVEVPVFRRGEIEGDGPWSVQIFDLQARALTLELPDETARNLVEQSISIHSRLTPTYLAVRLTGMEPYDFQGTFVSAAVESPTDAPDGDVPDSLLGLWRFDDGVGAAALDSSRYGRSALIVDGIWESGEGDGAVRLDGSSAYIDVGTSPVELGDDDFTAMVRIMSDHAPDDDFIGLIGYGDNVDGWLFGFVPVRNTITIELHDRLGQQMMILQFPAVLSPGEWYDLAFTKQGNQYQVFVNGEPIGSPQAGYADVSNDRGRLYVGFVPWWSGGNFAGLIDEARIYAEAVQPN